MHYQRLLWTTKDECAVDARAEMPPEQRAAAPTDPPSTDSTQTWGTVRDGKETQRLHAQQETPQAPLTKTMMRMEIGQLQGFLVVVVVDALADEATSNADGIPDAAHAGVPDRTIRTQPAHGRRDTARQTGY